MRHIKVVGASASGKTWLVGHLAQALADRGEAIQIEEVALEAFARFAGFAGQPEPTTILLLLGLDLNPPTPAQLFADQALRLELATAAVPFQVIYGQGQQRLLNALQAVKVAGSESLDAVLADADTTTPKAMPAKRKPWVWSCEKCSDPVCEHRLLSDLIASR